MTPSQQLEQDTDFVIQRADIAALRALALAAALRKSPGSQYDSTEDRMTPDTVLAAERAEIERLKLLPRTLRSCEYHGDVVHVSEDDEVRCLPCAVERVDSMAGAIPVPDESETCPNCGEPHVWHGRDEKDRVCFQCRYPESDRD